jgi:hypothetical protein
MSKSPVKSSALVNYDAKLLDLAQKQAVSEKNTGGGANFSIRGGILKLAGNEIPNNQMGVICLDSIILNAYYTEAFDPDEKSPPECYAFGYDEDEIAPHEDCSKPQADDCKSCEHNQWGSAEKGKGKACGNRRKIACIPAGIYTKDGKFDPFTEAEDFENSKISMLTLPPTSLNSWGAFIKTLAATKIPSLAVMTRVIVEQDQYPKVNFSAIIRVPMGLLPVIIKRYEEAKELMITPYTKVSEAPKPDKNKKRKY